MHSLFSYKEGLYLVTNTVNVYIQIQCVFGCASGGAIKVVIRR